MILSRMLAVWVEEKVSVEKNPIIESQNRVGSQAMILFLSGTRAVLGTTEVAKSDAYSSR